ncbi:hypothetical protein A2865_04550 [Candidatus Woesebacteria bacterium RIFCSPHIGHO2_01_FULL_39_17]|nr:MAG: hypothetical protein A2865_04550 [Candidatus Woesebacteria bacterium RIFCSPHIGHO2_01_FULL_39_17]OGM63494.1 MAG: hypothetical protein A3A52_05110 [Candidatus Woesebacteria bacterium RIFCSPLOWO2_01_FULL_39_14]
MNIKRIEKEIRDTPYHKGTEHHIGRLRAKLAKLKDGLRVESVKKGGGGGYAVKKQGDAAVILIGPPSAGKSTLINKLTNAQSKVAPYAFTTVNVIPGMMIYKNARIQILDVPGLIEGAEEGRGRGREVLSVARGADLIILMTDVDRPEATERIKKTLEENGIRLNIVRPNVIIDKKVSGGLTLHSNIKQDLTKETIKSIAQELGIKNAEITINEKLTIERLIDAFSLNRVYVPSISIINKADLNNKVTGAKLIHPAFPTGRPPGVFEAATVTPLFISAEKGTGLTELKEKMWLSLNFLRGYLVRPDEDPDFDNPIIMKVGSTLYDVGEKLGEDFVKEKIKAKIWGAGSKFPGQEVSLSTKLAEGMQVRFI